MRSDRTPEAWLSLGLAQLGERGPDALTVEALCARARKTRGSFYHHFADHAAFLDALMEHWRKEATAKLIAIADAEPDPNKRRRVLNQLTIGLNPRIETAIRRLVAIEPRLKTVLDHVDRQRIQYAAKLVRDVLGVSPKEAEERAWIEYACLVGLNWLEPSDPTLLPRLRRRFDSFAWRRQA